MTYILRDQYPDTDHGHSLQNTIDFINSDLIDFNSQEDEDKTRGLEVITRLSVSLLGGLRERTVTVDQNQKICIWKIQDTQTQFSKQFAKKLSERPVDTLCQLAAAVTPLREREIKQDPIGPYFISAHILWKYRNQNKHFEECAAKLFNKVLRSDPKRFHAHSPEVFKSKILKPKTNQPGKATPQQYLQHSAKWLPKRQGHQQPSWHLK